MGIAKVILNGSTLIDLTDDTVEASKLLSGYTATAADGDEVSGSIATKSSSDLMVSGATVTAPAGYYASEASESVSSGSATTPATTITANPTISVNSSTGLITASNSKTQSVTPTVSAGYVSSGTAGTITVSGSNTSQLTVQASQTITPTTTDQTIAAGKYLTGAQTIKGDANLIAANIADGVTIFGITGTHKGGDIVIIGTNITVPIASWDTYIPATNTEEENIFDLGYQYRATVPLSNVTSDMFPIIVWSLYTLDESGADLIDLYQCTTGGVYIYADTIPEVPILALTVECRKENT